MFLTIKKDSFVLDRRKKKKGGNFWIFANQLGRLIIQAHNTKCKAMSFEMQGIKN